VHSVPKPGPGCRLGGFASTTRPRPARSAPAGLHWCCPRVGSSSAVNRDQRAPRRWSPARPSGVTYPEPAPCLDGSSNAWREPDGAPAVLRVRRIPANAHRRTRNLSVDLTVPRDYSRPPIGAMERLLPRRAPRRGPRTAAACPATLAITDVLQRIGPPPGARRD